MSPAKTSWRLAFSCQLHTQQLLAASLGYGSLAAIQASTEEAPGIAGADFVILDVAGLFARAASLGYGAASNQITDAIASAIKRDPEPPAVFLALLDFIEEVAARFANERDRPNLQVPGCRGDGVTEADIDLGLAACSGQIACNHHANATVASFLADLLDRDGGWVKHNAVVDRYSCDVPEYLGHGPQITGTETQ